MSGTRKTNLTPLSRFKTVKKKRTNNLSNIVGIVESPDNNLSNIVGIRNENNNYEDSTLYLVGDEEVQERMKFQDLKNELKLCESRCREISERLRTFTNNVTYSFELNREHKLKDLLIKIVLTPSSEWRENILKLIEIPPSVKDTDTHKNRVSGPSYFEALFQLAFYLGLFPEIKSYSREFISKKEKIQSSDDFLYSKSVNNQGGQEQGISDITFRLVKEHTTKTETPSYRCGEIPQIQTSEAKNPTYFISVKRYTNEKSLKYYDISEIFNHILKEHTEVGTNYFICICCKNKDEFMRRMGQCKSAYLTMTLNKVFGFDELMDHYEEFRSQVFSNINKSSITEKDVKDWVSTHYPNNKDVDVEILNEYEVKINKKKYLYKDRTVYEIKDREESNNEIWSFELWKGDIAPLKIQELFSKKMLTVKPPLSLYFHQELIVTSALNRIEEQQRSNEKDKSRFICIGVLPRGGKSFIAGGIIKRMMDKKTPFHILFVTSAINETMSQFKEDLIEKFSDFSNVRFINLIDVKHNASFVFDNKQSSFIFVSRENMTGHYTEKPTDKKKQQLYFKDIFKHFGGIVPQINVVFFDEAHRGGITDRTKDAIVNSKFINKDAPFILMSATYKKLLSENGFIKRQKDLFVWDLDDIEVMKKLPVIGKEGFREGELNRDGKLLKYNMFYRFNEETIQSIIDRRLSTGESLAQIAKPYLNFPSPYFLSASFHPKIVSEIKLQQRTGGKEGFSLQQHFELDLSLANKKLLLDNSKVNDWHGAFKNKPLITALRAYFTPNDSEIKIQEKDRVLNRIFSIAVKQMGPYARPAYGKPFSILMFLPFGQKGQQIGFTCKAWGSLLLQVPYWKNNFIILGLSEVKDDEVLLPGKGKKSSKSYNCLTIKPGELEFCSEENLKGDDLKTKIVSLEKRALDEGKGLVILSGDRAAMGISLPCVDLVCLLNDESESDMIIQKMYRALTDSPGKRLGFIFDFNLRRIFNAKFEYSNFKNFGKNKPTYNDLFEQEFNTCMWDSDAWATYEPGQNFNDYMKQIKDTLFDKFEEGIYKKVSEQVVKDDINLLSEETIPDEIIALIGGQKPTRKPNPVTKLQEPGTEAPPPPKAKGEEENSDENVGESKEEEDIGEGEDDKENADNSLSDEENNDSSDQLVEEKRLLAILTKQFVNLLFLRNQTRLSSGSSISLSSLLDDFDDAKAEFKKTKLPLTDSCEDEQNLYVRVYNDLKNFIPIPEYIVINKQKIAVVGPAVTTKKEVVARQEDYSKIPIKSKLFIEDEDNKEQYAIYHPLATKQTVNKWAVRVRKGKTTNIFERVKIELDDGEKIKLDDFVKDASLHRKETTDETFFQSKEIEKMLGFLRERLSEGSNAYLNYSNYIEAFEMAMTNKAPLIQTDSHNELFDQNAGGESSVRRYNEILKVIDEHLVPDEVGRTQRGEIFTPPHLIREMLFGINKKEFLKNETKIFGINDSNEFVSIKELKDSERVGGLPESVWTNKNLKWLDMANGIGNFPIIAFYKLDFMLRDQIKSDDDRRKHIIENMLYMIELDPGNVQTSRGLFRKIHPKAKPNILCGNSLTLTFAEIKKEFGIDKFDVIMGNPPFNPPKTETGSSGNSIWQNFVMKSFFMLNDNGHLCFVHPPGWKKPTESKFDPDKFKTGNFSGQIRQGEIWPVLKESGNFTFICTNDQRYKKIGSDYLDYFPAVDYYIFQKNVEKSSCNSKNIFLGRVICSEDVRLNYDLEYLPNLITTQTQNILYKLTTKDGDKPTFTRFRAGKGFSIDPKKGKFKYIYTFDKKSEPKYQYSNIKSDNIDINKVIMNFDGGIDSYSIKFVKKEAKLGSYEMTMYSEVDSEKEGENLEVFFNSSIIKFIFLITQYASGKMTKNEPLVANSLTIPPEETKDYFKFFDIEKYKEYIESALEDYEKFKSKPKIETRKKSRNSKEAHKTTPSGNARRFRKTRKLRR